MIASGMHLMPIAQQLNMLVGDEIGQICLDPYGIQFKFDRWTLCVQHDIIHVEPDDTKHHFACVAFNGPPLMLHRLLQKAVITVERKDLEFTLHFICGSSLIVYTEQGPYECGQLISSTNYDYIVF